MGFWFGTIRTVAGRESCGGRRCDRPSVDPRGCRGRGVLGGAGVATNREARDTKRQESLRRVLRPQAGSRRRSSNGKWLSDLGEAWWQKYRQEPHLPLLRDKCTLVHGDRQ